MRVCVCVHMSTNERVKHQGHVSLNGQIFVYDLLSRCPPIEQRRMVSAADDNGLYQGALRVSRPQ